MSRIIDRAGPQPARPTIIRVLDAVFLLGGLAILILFTTHYQMPFRLDDVLHMDWARDRSFWDSWHPVRGEIVRSVRPMFAATIWLLTHYAGTENYFSWHLTLVASFLIGLAYSGLTARYLTGRSSALYIVALFYWLAFSSIVNVLFWYGDLTFTIELMFLTPAWYYGLRGLLEGKLGLWLFAMLLGSFAVMSKEPAIVLVHGVLFGAFVLRREEVKLAWQGKGWHVAVIGYILLLCATAYIYLASPTRSNRFFSLSDPNLAYFMQDRLRYYGAVILSPASRMLLFTPFIWILLTAIPALRRLTGLKSLLTMAIAVVLSLLLNSLPVAILLVFAAIAVEALRRERSSYLMLPFAIGAAIIIAALLFTVTLTKTQLNEFALTFLVVVAWGWTRVGTAMAPAITPYWVKHKLIVAGGLVLLVVVGVAKAIPFFRAKERLLSDVRDVRANANDAIKWSARNLPQNALLAVTGPNIHGLKGADELTSKDDETKLRQQYTFLQGYVYIYLRQLGREDIQHAYLEDPAIADRVLDSMRTGNSNYLFLQTEPDYLLFHEKYLKPEDSLVASFAKGPYPSEIWLLRR